ncbi:MAG: DUF424 domain-containing protein [Candidatus Heimdallarchaeota archaeon]|nr:DUF424 domain-containing protein [Candidatus Heimdallarchaeota archaeon]
MQFIVKVYQEGRQRLIAICDEEIRGARLKHKGVTIVVRKEFYGNEVFTLEEALGELSRCTSINAFGTNICNLLVEKELVHPATVLWIKHNGLQVGHVIVVK